MELTENAMRAAIAARDPSMDGKFFYGVVTTGVCCRPACRSRSPRPENLRFFANLADARRAGFRPCKRCRPELADSTDERRILDIARWLLAHPDSEGGLAQLARRAHWSPAHLQRRFKSALGASPREFQEAARLGKLRSLLRQRGSIARALLDAGFGSQSEGYRVAQRTLGMSPARYRDGAQRETIFFGLARSSLGWVLLAATGKGVCFAQFGATPEELRRELAREFPAALLVDAQAPQVAVPAAVTIDDWLAILLRNIDRGRPLGRIPLDLRGTAFQIRVWRELRRIASGSTRSYAQLANKLRAPRATRAVASACARNKVAVLVPCHRVIRGDGSLAGYRWGLERKRELLEREKRND